MAHRTKRQRRMIGADERVITADAKDGQVPALWEPDYNGEAKTLARLIVTDPLYLHNLRQRMLAGTIAPAVENMIWERAFGKVKEEIEVKKIESIRIVHEYLEDNRASQMAALNAMPGEVVEAKLLGEHTEQSPEGRGAGQGDGDSSAVEPSTGAGDEEPCEIPRLGGEHPVGENDGRDLEAD